MFVAGELFRGTHGFGGELGHVVVDPSGARCACGARGCLETVAGRAAVLRAAGVPPRAGAAELLARAEAGEGRALAALAGAGRALGIALTAVVNVLDPEAVLLGGYLTPFTPWLEGPVSAELGAPRPGVGVERLRDPRRGPRGGRRRPRGRSRRPALDPRRPDADRGGATRTRRGPLHFRGRPIVAAAQESVRRATYAVAEAGSVSADAPLGGVRFALCYLLWSRAFPSAPLASLVRLRPPEESLSCLALTLPGRAVHSRV